MKPITIIVPGTPIIKKNTMGTSYYYTDKYGRRHLRMDKKGNIAPVKFYTKVYQNWAKEAILACHNFVAKHPEYTFPLENKMNAKMLFYFDDNRIRDLSNLYEGMQDVMAGNPGFDIKLPKSLYQIIRDDSNRFIGSHDGSRCLIDLVHPRLEITLTTYTYTMQAEPYPCICHITTKQSYEGHGFKYCPHCGGLLKGE